MGRPPQLLRRAHSLLAPLLPSAPVPCPRSLCPISLCTTQAPEGSSPGAAAPGLPLACNEDGCNSLIAVALPSAPGAGCRRARASLALLAHSPAPYLCSGLPVLKKARLRVSQLRPGHRRASPEQAQVRVQAGVRRVQVWVERVQAASASPAPGRRPPPPAARPPRCVPACPWR